MTTAITDRKFNAAPKLAVADHKISDDTNFRFYRIGSGFHSEYGIYWPSRLESARIHVRDDQTIYVGYKDQYEKGSNFERSLCEWSPAK